MKKKNKIGYSKIPHILIESATMSIGSLNALKVLLVIWRKTIGYGKNFDYISRSQIQDLSGISLRRITTSLDELQELGFITKETGSGRGYLTKISLNLDISFYKELILKAHSQKGDKSVPLIEIKGDKCDTKGGQMSTPLDQIKGDKRVTHKRNINTKEILQKKEKGTPLQNPVLSSSRKQWNPKDANEIYFKYKKEIDRLAKILIKQK